MNSATDSTPAGTKAGLSRPGASNGTSAVTTIATSQVAWPATRAVIVLGGLVATVAVAVLVCVQVGAESIPFERTVRVLLSALMETTTIDRFADPDTVIILHLRVPRLMLAFCVGGALAVVGTCLQALLRNPLADPYVLGISSGATLGATLAMTTTVITTWLGSLGVPLCALAGGLCVMALLYRLSSSDQGLPLQTVLLLGVVFNAIFSAMTMFLTSVLSPEHLSRVLSWLMGSLTAVDGWRLIATGAGLAVGLVVLMRHARDLNALLLGEEPAQTLGISVETVKRTVFFTCAAMTGLAVAVSGMIGFVGMVVPHALRLMIGTDHRLLLPAAALGGGAFLLCADTLARTLVAPSELPVGVMTALVGGPMFVHILVTHRHRQTIGAGS